MTLAAYIREDLRGRLRAGGAPPRLTLRDLSAHYGVSLTPVRRAVDELLRDGSIRKAPNGRLAPGERPAAAKPLPSPADRERAISQDLLKRSLEGKAEFLREEAAARAYGVGRTALRRVFSRLAAEGLLEHVPRRGWRVRPFRQEEMEAYLEVREVLELKALDLALPRLDRPTLGRLLAENRCSGGDPHVDGELHAVLIAKSGNRYLQDFFRRHGAYFTTLFYYAALGAAVVDRMARQHREVLRALLAGRPRRAKEALARHIRAQRPVLAAMMKRLASLPVERWPELP
jgi:DNA-binding GntR family transcriptional regulator